MWPDKKTSTNSTLTWQKQEDSTLNEMKLPKGNERALKGVRRLEMVTRQQSQQESNVSAVGIKKSKLSISSSFRDNLL